MLCGGGSIRGGGGSIQKKKRVSKLTIQIMIVVGVVGRDLDLYDAICR